MFQYILKRLLLMFVTLFGITVITFVITRLAPGDPAVLRVQGGMAVGGRGQQLSEAIIEENRKILGLDKPVVFNVNPKGRHEHVLDMIDDLRSKEEYVRKRGRDRLRVLKSAALPEVTATLDQTTSPALRERLLEQMPVLTGLRPPADYVTLDPEGRADWWVKWWEKNRADYSDKNVNEVVQKFFSNPTQESLDSVTSLGGVVVPHLIPTVGGKDASRSDWATAALATVIAKSAWSNRGVEQEDKRALNVHRWRRWWRYNGAEFVEHGPTKRFILRFTDTQYGVWLGKILRFDFDESYSHRKPVLDLIAERLPISVQLSLISIFLSYLIAIPLGIFSATHQYSLGDKATTTTLFVLYSLPSFWVASLMILFVTEGGLLFKIQEGWGVRIFFPVQGLHSPGAGDLPFWSWFWDWMWHLVLPVTCLTYASLAFLSRQMRVAMLETVRQDFIRTAQAKGLSRRAVIFKHALRNSMIPILTLMASLLPELLGGSIIIETIFGIPGMGRLTFDSILNRDYPVINAVIFFSAFLTLLGILLSDLSYALVDPRIRYE